MSATSPIIRIDEILKVDEKTTEVGKVTCTGGAPALSCHAMAL